MLRSFHRELHDHWWILFNAQSCSSDNDRSSFDVRGISADRVRDAKLCSDREMIDQISEFLESDAYQCLTNEADYNHHAFGLLEDLHLIIDSALFFLQIDEKHRFNLEIQRIKHIINLVTKLYEE